MDRFLLVFLLLISMESHAHQKEIIFTPVTPVSFTITKKDVAIVTYAIMNRTDTTQKLNVVVVDGVKPLKGNGYCGAGMVLLPKQGCMLSLQLTGKYLKADIKHMPFLCTPNLSQCYFPDEEDQMDIILKG